VNCSLWRIKSQKAVAAHLSSAAELQQIQQRSPTDQTRIKIEPQLTRKQQEIDELLKAEAQKLQQLRPVSSCAANWNGVAMTFREQL